MENNYLRTKIWKTSLSDESMFMDSDRDSVLLLRNTYLRARDNAKQISDKIIKDIPTLTLHNFSHSDSLWETASIINGDKILNPLDAFIFGCCSIFHDLGLSLSCYEENEITNSAEFRDMIYHLSNENEKKELLKNHYDTSLIRKELVDEAIQIRLRQLHAQKARDLPKKSWDLNGKQIFIIQDNDIRKFLGEKIGILSESHWWNIDKIRNEFKDNLFSAAPVSFSSDWKIDNIKLACLLRLADYINIDYRRAPDLTFSTAKLNGVAKHHWTFQNKMNRPILVKDTLVFESLEHFGINDIDAWWLAYNTLCDIHKEIKDINDLLVEFNLDTFLCARIKGIESSESLSKFIKTKDWHPVNTQYKVSDVKILIERFGGEKLYGKRLIIPIRELIQNSHDAIKAKEYYESTIKGKITVGYNINGADEYLIVEDNGIGMTKYTLLNFLLDFGKSYWGSKEMLNDHPGLYSGGFKSSGKYGIGFYSTFMIANKITIISRALKDSKTIVLEFNEGLNNPPIFRNPTENEEMFNSGTKIILKLKISQFIENLLSQLVFAPIFDNNETALKYICNVIAPASEVDITIKINNENEQYAINANDWMKINNESFLSRLTGIQMKESMQSLYSVSLAPITKKNILNEFQSIAENISFVYNDKDEMIGRATIVPPKENFYDDIERIEKSKYNTDLLSRKVDNSFTPFVNFYTGILTVNGLWENSGFPFAGLWKAQNTKLDRLSADLNLFPKEIKRWIEEQSELLSMNVHLDIERKLRATALLYEYGSANKDLPIVVALDKLISLKNFEQICETSDYIFLHNITNISDFFPYLPNIYGIPGKFNSNFAAGFKGHLNKKEHWIKPVEDFSLYNNSKLQVIYNTSILRKVIEVICTVWGYQFGDCEIIDLIEESYIKMDGKLLSRQISKEGEGNTAVIINSKKVNRKEVLDKYKGIVREIVMTPYGG